MTDLEFGDEDARFAGLELLATAVLLIDGDRHIFYANAAAENLFALSRKHLIESDTTCARISSSLPIIRRYSHTLAMSFGIG